MKITLDSNELARVEGLLPESAKLLIHLLGYPAASRLITRFGGVSLGGKSGRAQTRTGGVHAFLREVLSEEECQKLIVFQGANQFYIPRCEAAMRQLRNMRFMFALSEKLETGLSIRQALGVLCPHFGISDRQAWKIINSHVCGTVPRQSGLFDN